MQGYLFILLAGVILSTNSLFTKLIGDALPAPTLVFYRCCIAALVLAVICPYFDKKTFKMTKKDLNERLILGVIFASSLILSTTAFQKTTIQLAIALINLGPFIVLLLAFFFLKERLTKEKIIALLIAFTGVLIINPLTKISLSGEGLGALFALIVAFTTALFSIFTKKFGANHSIGTVFWFFLIAAILTFPAPFIFGFGDPLSVWPHLLWVGVITGALAYICYDLGMKQIEAGKAALIFLVTIPLFAILWGIVLLGETIDSYTIVGAFLLVLAGLYLQINSKLHLHVFHLLHRKKGGEDKEKKN